MTMMNGRSQGMPGTPGLRSLGRVGLWGAPGSGKTTFLAALSLAVQQTPQDLAIFGVDTESTAFLKQGTAALTSRRTFPASTQAGTQYSWVLRMTTQVPEKKFMKTKMTTVPLELNLDLLDEPGRVFGVDPDQQAGAEPVGGSALGFDDDDDDDMADGGDYGIPAADGDDVMDRLASCDGLLLLFDPVQEWKAGDAYEYFQGTLLELAQRRMMGGAPGDKMPQYVAVCVTKFDHPDVYRRARTSGLRTFSVDDPAFFPRVPDHLAERFFGNLVRESRTGNAEFIGSALRKYFYPDRVKFFITSAVGFYKNPQSMRFQERDPMNLVPQEGGKPPLIRGPVHPINVAEPLVWLGQNLAAGR
jgi:energy-coupling factor transporter ATP-binding protein EcfA2